jgi:hypothetical protein
MKGSHSEVPPKSGNVSILGAIDLAGFFTFPISSLLERPIEFHGAGTRAVVDTRAAVPAFLWMQDDGALAILWIGNKHIHWAALDARIASIAYFRIKNCRPARRRSIGKGMNCHSLLLIKPD